MITNGKCIVHSKSTYQSESQWAQRSSYSNSVSSTPRDILKRHVRRFSVLVGIRAEKMPSACVCVCFDAYGGMKSLKPPRHGGDCSSQTRRSSPASTHDGPEWRWYGVSPVRPSRRMRRPFDTGRLCRWRRSLIWNLQVKGHIRLSTSLTMSAGRVYSLLCVAQVPWRWRSPCKPCVHSLLLLRSGFDERPCLIHIVSSLCSVYVDTCRVSITVLGWGLGQGKPCPQLL